MAVPTEKVGTRTGRGEVIVEVKRNTRKRRGKIQVKAKYARKRTEDEGEEEAAERCSGYGARREFLSRVRCSSENASDEKGRGTGQPFNKNATQRGRVKREREMNTWTNEVD